MIPACAGLMDTMKMIVRTASISLLALAVAAFLTACVAVPAQLEGEYAAVSPASVQPEQFGTSVRWGGVLVDTRNEQNRTCFEVLSRELDRYMRPEVTDTTLGRFIACTDGFHDPEVYAKGREVTVVGQIQSIEDRKIEEFAYRYPVLEVTDLVLWEKRKTVMHYNNYYDPFYYPYYWGRPYWGGYYYPYYGYPGWGVGFGGGYAYPRETRPGPSEILTRKKP
jgi:outer membrane lipoprotein